MFSYFENRKTTYFDVFCLNFSIETKIKTLFLISSFSLSKKRNGTLDTRIDVHMHEYVQIYDNKQGSEYTSYNNIE